MYCVYCGKIMKEHYVFCPNCGQRQTEKPIVPHSILKEPQEIDYAVFWKRVLAAIIDIAIITGTISLLAVLYSLTDFILPIDLEGLWVPFAVPAFILFIWLYYAVQECSIKQATFGKRLLKIRIMGSKGQPVTFARATARFFAKFLSVISQIGMILPLWTDRRQALHDLLAKTIVIDSPNP